MYALSLDMGGTHIGCAVVRDRDILASASLDTCGAGSLSAMLPLIAETQRSLLRRAELSAADCAGIAVGFPGIVDTRHGRVLSTLKKFEDAIHLDIAAWARDTFGLRICVENDARLALLGEQYAGAAREISDVVMMMLGTGIGTAVMIEGRLLRGAHAQAACLGGHLIADFEGRLCHCGNVGCAEAEASGWSLPEIVRGSPGFGRSALAHAANLDFRTLFEAADAGDTLAKEVRDRCLAVWAANVVSLIHAYDPEIVVLGGGVMSRADIVLRHIEKHVAKHAWTAWGKPAIRAAALGNSAAFLGAVPLLSEDSPQKNSFTEQS